jgi:hypothetical protein
MFKKFLDMMMLKATWVRALGWLIIAEIVYFSMLNITIPMVEKQADGNKIFDLMPFGYSSEYAIDLLNSLGEQGRGEYLTYQIPLDLLYPGLMGIAGAFLITLLTKEISQRFRWLIFLPLLAALFDYLENGMVAIMLIKFPSISDTIIVTASTFTILKSLFTTIYMSVGLLLFVLFLIQLFKRR